MSHAPQSGPAIAVRDVSFRYGGVAGRPAVLEQVTLDVPDGEFLGLVGPNGGGKSTLLKLMLGLLEPERGSVRIFGRRPREARGLLGYVPQFRTFTRDFPISVGKAVLQGRLGRTRRLFGYGADDRAIAARAMADVGIADLAARPLGTLSGGQLQRVLIARALACEPRLVILDEAVSALDKSVEAQVLNLLMDLKEEFGLTYLFISHDLHVVRYISDRVMVMYLGKVAETGPAEALFRQPHHPYTRALLSSMPSMDPDRRTEEAALAGDPPNPIDPPPGCRFHTRCPLAEAVCSQRAPSLKTRQRRETACLIHEPGSGHSHAAAAAAAVHAS